MGAHVCRGLDKETANKRMALEVLGYYSQLAIKLENKRLF